MTFILPTVQKSIPVPEPHDHRKGKGPWQAFLRGLEIGDSFLIPESEKNVGRNMPYAAKSVGIKLTRRTMDDGSVRFWRIA